MRKRSIINTLYLLLILSFDRNK